MEKNEFMKTILEKEYSRFTQVQSPYEKIQSSYTIITIKNDNPSFKNFQRPLYNDVKEFINDYVKSVDGLSYGYDVLDIQKIHSVIQHLPIKESVSMSIFLLRSLKNSGFEEEYKESVKYRERLQIRMAYEMNKFTFIFKYLLNYSSKSLLGLSISMVVFGAIIYLLLLPTSVQRLQLFSIKYDHYSDSFILNHGLNLICNAVEIGESFSILPLNLFGLVLLILGKVSFIVIVGNFLLQELIRKISE